MIATGVPTPSLQPRLPRKDLTAGELLRDSRLDFMVTLHSVQTSEGIAIPQKRAVVRTDDASVLGVVGRSYVPVQNEDAFSFLDTLVAGHEIECCRAGAFRNGAKIWMQVRLPGTIRVGNTDDLVDQFLLLCNTFDGSSALRVLFTPVRIVCENTLNLAIQKGKRHAVSIRHQGDLKSKIRETREVLGLASQFFGEAQAGINLLAAHPMTSDQAGQYFAAIYPDPSQGDNARARATRGRLLQLFDDGVGADMPRIRHTAWAAYNSVTEWVDHHRPTRAASPIARGERRAESAWFGSGSRLKAKAWQLAVSLAS